MSEHTLTDFKSLDKVIGEANAVLQCKGIDDQIDVSLVRVRNALVHGRIYSASPNGLRHLIKFDKPEDHYVRVALLVDMTPDWLRQQNGRILSEITKVIGIAQELGFSTFPPDQTGLPSTQSPASSP